ncbi:MAG: NMD3-related protein [Thermoplasmata archaeon]
MADGEFCVVCGKTGIPLVEGVCSRCASERTSQVDVVEAPTVILCPVCGARKVGPTWSRQNAPMLLTGEDLNPLLRIHPEVTVRRIEWAEVAHRPALREYRARVHLRFREQERVVERAVSVRVERRPCVDCSRKTGHYYTSVIQVRSEEGGRHEPAEERRERLARQWDAVARDGRPDWARAISWREALPEGWDLFFTDTLVARAMAKLAKQRAGADLKESATLVGRRHGEDVYRVTFCLRFPRPTGPDEPPKRVGRRTAAWNNTLKKRPRVRTPEDGSVAP